MRKGRRSEERLFYCGEDGDCSNSFGTTGPESPRSFPFAALRVRMTRLKSSFAMVGVMIVMLWLAPGTGRSAWAQGPQLTTISDTVYRADGTTATGTALISWPAFVTGEGDAVAAGGKSVEVAEGGAFATQLAATVGASPAGTFYTVVFQLDDGTVRTEYWSVPTNSPVKISDVRTTPGTGLANGLASQQYVQQAVADRALDASVVHLGGEETVNGTKQFAAPPSVPAPEGANDAANKAYVDQAVANVGAGNYVAKSGDAMTGPLSLPGENNDIRRGVYDRLVSAAIAAVISAGIAMHDRFFK